METVYTGLDAGSSSCKMVTTNEDGKPVQFSEFMTAEANLIRAAKEIPGRAVVHLEASELAGWIRGILRREKRTVQRVIVSDPKLNAWIAKDPRKNDKVDAFKLAELARMGRFNEVYYPDEEGRAEFKILVQHYERLTRQAVRVKLQIKSCLRLHGVIVKNKKLFSKEGRVPVLNEVSSEVPHKMLRQHYAVMDSVLKQRKEAAQLIRRESRKYPEIALLSEIPGVKGILAARFSAYVQNPHRFRNRKRLFRYCCLGIVDRSSDDKPLGHQRLDRQGNGSLKDLSRKVFMVACKRCKKDNAFRRFYEKSLEATRDEKHARLSTQRKILNVMWTMWRNNQHYDDSRG
jgi:transposase